MLSTRDLILMSSKGHPEVVGKGIDFFLGLFEARLPSANNDCVAKNLHDNVRNACSLDTLPLSRVGKFARRARECRRAYKNGANYA